MSGTEAVMQAVRLARYHTGRSHLVRFCGAYHGWWDGVQAGPGNPRPAPEVHTLSEMSERTLRVLRTRRDIACVLVNPLQALSPNGGPASDSSLISGDRRARFDRAAYTAWLKALRQVCDERGIALIFDEVFLGFRLAPGGAQEYFGVRADLVTYGKTLGGGLPVGVLCGKHDWMRRFRPGAPADICFARGTFNSHPLVMAAMNAFLRRLERPELQATYTDLDARWDGRRDRLNDALAKAGAPVRFENMVSVFTTLYTQPGQAHWLFQFYLRRAGLVPAWIGSGRFIFPHSLTEDELDEISRRLVAAAVAMRDDGWWWRDEALTDKAIKRRLSRDLLVALRARLSGRLFGARPALPPAADGVVVTSGGR
jgi:glutamate-1-semialdehyde 2,1-aminomutase